MWCSFYWGQLSQTGLLLNRTVTSYDRPVANRQLLQRNLPNTNIAHLHEIHIKMILKMWKSYREQQQQHCISEKTTTVSAVLLWQKKNIYILCWSTYRSLLNILGRYLLGNHMAMAHMRTHKMASSSNIWPRKLRVAWKYVDPIPRRQRERHNWRCLFYTKLSPFKMPFEKVRQLMNR